MPAAEDGSSAAGEVSESLALPMIPQLEMINSL